MGYDYMGKAEFEDEARAALKEIEFDAWMKDLANNLGKAFGMDGAEYIRQTGTDCWREMHDDGMSPEESAAEEVSAAATML